jgi:GSH-dependent disulfide-bond oxidoreductase
VRLPIPTLHRHKFVGAQQQDLDSFPNLRRWFNVVRKRPATQRAYVRGEPYASRPAVTEEGKRILFGQTAQVVQPSV